MVKVRKRWRRFYRANREVLDFIGDFLGALSIFVLLFSLYILGVMMGGM